MAPKLTTCKVCGEPRDPDISKAMCRDCYNQYMMEYYHKKRGVSISEIKLHQAESERQRLNALRQTYARLGLEAGKVRKQRGVA
jgi:hypothetical protein